MSRLFEKVHYLDLTDLEQMDLDQSVVNVDDRLDMMLLNEFKEWFGSDKIELNKFEDKWFHFLDVREV